MADDYGRIPTRPLASGTLLLQLGRTKYRGTPLHFGRDAANRFDDPDKQFGVLYAVGERELSTALMETVFHDHAWRWRARRTVSLAEVRRRLVRVVGVMEEIVLADLTRRDVMASILGANLHQMTRRPYLETQGMSRRVHATGRYHGICYLSRNNPPARCFALFDHAAPRLVAVRDIDLDRHKGWPRFVRKFGVVVTPP